MATLALSLAGQAVGGLVAGPFGATIGRALGALAGSAVDAALFGEKRQRSAGADIRLQGSREGIGIPRLYGWSRLAGNIIWATELERLSGENRGGKGSSEAEEDTIAASFAIGLCEGEVARLGRIWADGQPLETEGLTLRFHDGGETQAADPLIAAVQGTAPAYRGLCYLVFEQLPLTAFGNRIPNITVELCRVVGELEPAMRSVTVIPGATEFGYDPEPRVRLLRPGETGQENAHLSARRSNWSLSIDELTDLCPNLEHVGLVVAWFGSDLRCGACRVEPKVEAASRTVRGASWSVAGLNRAGAELVSSHAGGAAYGGTPSDAAVKAAIADLKARGLAVTLYPMMLMDIPADNPMDQPAYPWRGRIACDPAPGEVGTIDGTAEAAAQVAAFVGGTEDWGYRRFVRHHAELAAEAGVDALVIGSEMRGLTRVRDGAGDFPFVAALRTLAAEARAITGPDIALTYAADWSEYGGWQPPDAPGDLRFPLDPLWADGNIDAVGIDWYLSVSDWRDDETQPDAAWGGSHDLAYLSANIAGGEDFDWYYQSEADRLAGLRTPITDGAHGEPWVWRAKDVAGWWSHAHHERIGGVRQVSPTGWVPEGKPVWLTELGCAAVDKGGNQPNVFPDMKSAEGGRPRFSTGSPDGLAQRQVLRAHMAHWSGAGNPVSGVYGTAMIPPERISLWTWDARPFPVFPSAVDVWADAPNHPAGHWLTGRLGGFSADELAGAVAADCGFGWTRRETGGPLLLGVATDGPAPPRALLEPVLDATGLAIRDGGEGLELVRPRLPVAAIIDEARLVADPPRLSRRHPDATETVAALALGFMDRSSDYRGAAVTASLPGAVGRDAAETGLVLDMAGATVIAERLLRNRAGARDTVELALPPECLGLEVGDTFRIGSSPTPLLATELRDGLARRLRAEVLPAEVAVTVTGEVRVRAATAAPASVPEVVALLLPPAPERPDVPRLGLAAHAVPWPGRIDIHHAGTGAALTRLERAASLGTLAGALAPGPIHCWDNRAATVTLFAGHVATIDDLAALDGGNRLAVETETGWEVLGFAHAELIGPGTYRLSRLLRGLGGSDPAMAPAAPGSRVVLLDSRVAAIDVAPGWLGGTLPLRAYAGPADATGAAFEVEIELGGVLPLPPGHLRARLTGGGDVQLGWIRRSRADSGSWALLDVPPEPAEGYRVEILDGSTIVRAIEVSAPSASYAAADQVADFGSLPASFDWRVRQLSPGFGPGHVAGGSFHA